MRILAVETATQVCAAALVEDGRVLAERSASSPRVHSDMLLPMVDDVLAASRLAPGDIDAVGISIGPGSFTGLRIGLSAAKGLCAAAGKPLVPVGTLEALTFRVRSWEGLKENDAVLALIDARRGEVYAAAYSLGGDEPIELVSPRALPPAALFPLLAGLGRIVATGEAAQAFLQALPSGNAVVLAPEALRACSASSVGLLAARRLARTGGADLALLEPAYVSEFAPRVQPGHPAVA